MDLQTPNSIKNVITKVKLFVLFKTHLEKFLELIQTLILIQAHNGNQDKKIASYSCSETIKLLINQNA